MLRAQARTYWHVFTTGVQGVLVYRWNIGIRAVFSLLHLVFVFALWGSAHAGQATIGGFDVRATLTYFVLLFVANFLVAAWSEDYQIAEEIRHGTINQFLLKPIDYFTYRIALFFSARAVSAGIAIVPLLVCLPLLSGHLALPSGAWRLLAVPAALLGAALIQFQVAYFFGLLAFWFLDIQGFVLLSLALESVLSGQLFPLDLAPPWAQVLLQFQPFYYMMFFPVALAAGRLGPEAALPGFAGQAFWIAALFLLNRAVWRRGLRLHTAVGG